PYGTFAAAWGLLPAASASAASAGHADCRFFSAASARRRRPAVHWRSVLHEPHIRTERVPGEGLLTRVAPEFARLKRRIPAHRQHGLVPRVGLAPTGEAREIGVFLDHHIDTQRPGNFISVDDAVDGLDHDDDEHVVVVRVLVSAGDPGPDRPGLARAGAAPAKRREARVAGGFQRLVTVADRRKDQTDRSDIGRLLN